ncbi:PilC/PilY family type IV pilus protein [Thalassolituus sp.]|jgi:type IV pilus assembly protein PilY1|uniref:PilC/PilY family type IV pilus protein n=1 Tax=Thalassolituus sp. TaxID=2030822 RepID=UPI002A7FFC2C|nr:PilC/PilY family type IV pilus protein [Thalassolituus sp.]
MKYLNMKKVINTLLNMRHIASFIVLISAPLFSIADDTEIYRTDATQGVQPNVIFVFDTSGSMGFLPDSNDKAQGTKKSRMDIVKQAAIDVIGDPTLANLNIGIMRFDSVESGASPISGVKYYKSSVQNNNNQNYKDGGGYVLSPISDINDSKHRNSILSAISGLEAGGTTPLVETYSEAIRYMRGDDVKFGKKYGKTEYVEGGTVLVQGPSRTEDIKECRKCSQWTGWGFLGACFFGQITTVNDSYCSDTYNNSYKWVVTGTNTIPGEFYEEEKTAGYAETSTAQYFYMSHPDSYNKDTGKYISPITNSCQKNHIFLFTDGVSQSDNEADDDIKSLLTKLDSSIYTNKDGISTNCKTYGDNYEGDITNSCMEELALAAYEGDNIADSLLLADSDPSTESQQSITTHTIGGFLNTDSKSVKPILERAADYSDGIYSEASDSEKLKLTLQNLFERVSADATGGSSAPVVAVNALNRLESSEELYYTTFEPKVVTGWSGNLKRYKLGSDGEILDKNDKSAVDANTGYFAKEATSIWSSEVDGNIVTKGGAASHLTLDRKVYTYLGGASKTIDDSLVDVNLSGVIVAATGMTPDIFDTELSGTDFLNMLKWASGITTIDGVEVARQEIEDPLHSQPIILNYGTSTNYNSTLFFGTNSGYLHAIDTYRDPSKNPKERFAYVPYELLPNINMYYSKKNEIGKTYGLDGPVSSLIFNQTDVDAGTPKRRFIVGSTDKAYLYLTMRRGGNINYAIDVTDRDTPKYLWQISTASSGFEELGQTWSGMTPVFINPKAIGVDSTKKSIPVLVFGGGYDPEEDLTSESVRLGQSTGNAIFIVDAMTGALLWKASSTLAADLTISQMTNSIASDITPVDNNGDGNVDILYASDIGGRLWRIDLFSDGTQKGTLLADLNTGNSVTNNTRFYTTPVVAYQGNENKGRYVITLGSGYRAHPLVTNNQDRFFVLFDQITSTDETSTKNALSTYKTKKTSDLANYSNIASASDDAKNTGFYYKLTETGEKSLSDSIVANNRIYFSTYFPNSTSNTSDLDSCKAVTGNARLYEINLGEYNPNKPLEDLSIEVTELKQSGIPAEPKIVFPPADENGTGGEDGGSGDDCANMAILVGSEVIKSDSCGSVSKSYWSEL